MSLTEDEVANQLVRQVALGEIEELMISKFLEVTKCL